MSTSQTIKTDSTTTTTLVCPVCHKKNTWTDNKYKQGLIFNCGACSARLQQIFCPHCSATNTCPNFTTSIEGRLINCTTCAKGFQFICCPHCQDPNIWPEANYEPGLVHKCQKCTKPFQQVSCPFCYESNVFPTDVSIQGERIECRSCARAHQYIRCPHCSKGLAWKNCDYTEGNVALCSSCKKNFTHIRCQQCNISNFQKNPQNIKVQLQCSQCKTNICNKNNCQQLSVNENINKRNVNAPSNSPIRIQIDLDVSNINQNRSRSNLSARTPVRDVTCQPVKDSASRSSKFISCPYFAECNEYVKQLNWSISFFNTNYDRCYCKNCYSDRSPSTLQVAGAEYVVPRRWAGFGLGVDPYRDDDIWNKWIVVYHGTSTNAAESILKHREFLLPGDSLLDGSKLEIRPGHIPGKLHIYTSPSIRYASHNAYSRTKSFKSPKTNQRYKVQIVLQCKQKPGTFKTQKETVGLGSSRICNYIPNERIEHFSDRRASVIPYRLLVRLRDEE